MSPISSISRLNSSFWTSASPSAIITNNEFFGVDNTNNVVWVKVNTLFGSPVSAISLNDGDRVARPYLKGSEQGLALSSETLTGLKYFEIKSDNVDSSTYLGVTDTTFSDGAIITHDGSGNFTLSDLGFENTLGTWSESPSNTYISGFAFDANTHTLYVSHNGTWVVGDPVAGTGGISFFPATYKALINFNPGTSQYTECRLQADYTTYAPPVGYTRLGDPVSLDSTATLTKTLDNLTTVSESTVSISSTLSVTLDTIVTSTTGLVDIVGNLSKSFDEATASSNGSILNSAIITKTLDDLTLSSNGAMVDPEIIGISNIQLDAIVVSSQSVGIISASSSITNAELTSLSTGTTSIDSQVSKNLNDIITDISTSIRIGVDVNTLLQDVVTSSSTNNIVTSALTVGLENLSATSDSDIIVDTNFAGSLDPVISTINANISISAASPISLGDLTSSSTANTTINSNLSESLDELGVSGSGNISTSAESNTTLNNLGIVSVGSISLTVSVNKVLDDIDFTSNIDAGSPLILNQNLGELFLVSSSDVDVESNVDKSLNDCTLNGQGHISLSAQANLSLEDIWVLGQTNNIGSASSATLLEDLEIEAEGTITYSIIYGEMIATLSPLNSLIKARSGSNNSIRGRKRKERQSLFFGF